MVLLYNSVLQLVGREGLGEALKSRGTFAKAIADVLPILSRDRPWAATADLYRLRMT